MALAKIKAIHWAGNDARLMVPFNDDHIQYLLATAMLIRVDSDCV
ncbi:hypothetical protein PT7_0224 [Pusillimonas sp. T7-7]|nr:hypothetical protein [Pusillimonas sp. T7-7]AEC18764.1 hypothetical protein PT7_0224 [Pusillimonas sp. T7-7]